MLQLYCPGSLLEYSLGTSIFGRRWRPSSQPATQRGSCASSGGGPPPMKKMAKRQRQDNETRVAAALPSFQPLANEIPDPEPVNGRSLLARVPTVQRGAIWATPRCLGSAASPSIVLGAPTSASIVDSDLAFRSCIANLDAVCSQRGKVATEYTACGAYARRMDALRSRDLAHMCGGA